MFFQMLIQKAGPVKGALGASQKCERFSRDLYGKFDFRRIQPMAHLLCCNMKCQPLRSSANKS
jgi:hypothetical protein